MKPDQFSVISEKLDSLQTSVNRIDKDLGNDREELQETRMRLGALEAIVDELRKDIKKNSEKTADKVEEVVQPVVEAMKAKKVIHITKPGWLNKLYFFWKGVN